MKLDIQQILKKLDKNDITICDSYVGDERKEFEKNISWMIPQWMTGAHTDVHHRNLIIMFDEVCNEGWGSFYKHPVLQAKLLSLIGPGRTVKHRFFPPTGNRKSTAVDQTIEDMLQHDYLDIRSDEVVLWCKTHTDDEFYTLLDTNGVVDDKQRRSLHKHYKRMQSS